MRVNDTVAQLRQELADVRATLAAVRYVVESHNPTHSTGELHNALECALLSASPARPTSGWEEPGPGTVTAGDMAGLRREPVPAHPVVCDECGAIHGEGNTNTLCPKASNYRGDAYVRELQREPVPVHPDTALLGRIAETLGTDHPANKLTICTRFFAVQYMVQSRTQGQGGGE